MVQLSAMLGLELAPGSSQEIESVESKLLGLPQCKYELISHFAPGVYVRELRVPRGTFILGHEHRHENLHVMAKGEKLVVIGDRVERMVAPHIVLSGAGVRKYSLIFEDMVWFSIHANPTNERDEAVLEEMLYRKTDTFKAHEKRRAEERLKELGNLLPDFSQPSTLEPA